MSDVEGGIPPVQPFGQPEGRLPDPEESFGQRLALAQRAGGLVAPLLTVAIAFVMGGLVVLITTGKNPVNTYKAIFEGAGLNWFFQIPWDFDSIAPTSRPRVGWAAIRTFGSRSISRASTTFCWFPPERPPARVVGPPPRTSNSRMSDRARSTSRRGKSHPNRDAGAAR